MIHGRDRFDDFEPVYTAAVALGLELLVVDTEDHWLRRMDLNTFGSLSFLHIDMTIDEGLPSRIEQALCDKSISAICTLSDRYLLSVAMAAELLGLPTNPVEAYRHTSNKFKVRQLDDVYGPMSAIVSDSHVSASLLGNLRYPLMVKPLSGWSSQHVYKVLDESQLQHALEQIVYHSYSRKALIEPFIEGPEVDANFILCNGELLWFEIKDEIPAADDFLENITCVPSILPNAERDCVREAGLRVLQRLGFHTGVFQVEARVENSTMTCTHQGYTDFHATTPTNDAKPSCFVIEVNARPGSFREMHATLSSSGLNWFEVWLSACLGDIDRMRSLTQAVQKAECTALMWLRANEGGRMLSRDPCKDLLRADQDLQQHVRVAKCFYREGDEIPSPEKDAPVNVGFVVLCSDSREAAVRMAHRVQDSFLLETDHRTALR